MFASYLVNTWVTASIAATVAGVVGFFTVLRGSSFAAHVLPNGAFAGAAGAVLLGWSTLLGLGAFAVLGAILIAVLGRRSRSDVATALTIVLLLAAGDLFLSRTTEYAPEIFSLLFGEILGVSANEILPTAAMAGASLLAMAALYRPLLVASVVSEASEARGIRTRWLEIVFLLVLALVTTMAVPVVGALLIFSLLIGPPAAARSFAGRPWVAIVLSVAFGLVTVWSSIAASYATNLPVGFFVGSCSAALYGLGRGWAAWRGARRAGPAGPDPGSPTGSLGVHTGVVLTGA